MKKRIFALTAAVISALMLFSACGEEHVHGFKPDWTNDETQHWHEASCGHDVKGDVQPHAFAVDSTTATCTEAGEETVTCVVCHYTTTRHADPLGHDPIVVVTPPTCETPGMKAHSECSRCHLTLTEGEPIVPTGKHFYDTEHWTTTPTHHYHAAICGCDRKADNAVHEFNDDFECTVCGYVDEDALENIELAKNFEFAANGEEYTVTGIKEGVTATDLKLPSYYEQKPVTAIADRAFTGTGITSFIMSATVESVGYYAFDDCTSLASVTFSEHLETIRDQAFADTAITSVTLPESLTVLADNLFMNCEELASVTLLGNVTKIGNQAFYGCKALHSIEIPETVSYIGQRAFAASGLTAVTVPSSVTELASFVFENCTSLATATVRANLDRHFGGWFAGCSALTEITVPFVGSHKDPDAVPTSTVFGYLFGRKAGDGLTGVEQGGVTYYIPSGLATVTVLGGYIDAAAFAHCSMVKTVNASGARVESLLTDWNGTLNT